MTTTTMVVAGVALATIVTVLLIVFRSLLWPAIKVLGWALAAIVTVTAIAAVMYYYVWSYIASAMPDWMSTALGIHKPDFGGWIAGFGIWTIVLVLAVLVAVALYLFNQISRRTLAGVLLLVVAAVLLPFAPWGTLLPDKAPTLPETPAWTTTLVPWLPAIAIVLAVLIALYLFNAMGGRKLAGALVLLLALALLPLVPWSVPKGALPQLTASYTNPLPATCDGKARTVTLTKKAEPIVKVPCRVAAETHYGKVTVIGSKPGERETFTGPMKWNFDAKHWWCEDGDRCVVEVALCPSEMRWNDEAKKCGVRVMGIDIQVRPTPRS